MAEQGLVVKSGPNGIRMGYENFLPDPALFRQTRKLAKGHEDEDVVYPNFLVRAVKDGKIPESYLAKLAEWVEQSSDQLFPHDWTHVIEKCWEEHKSLKAKKSIPYPALKFLGETAHKIWSLRENTTVV